MPASCGVRARVPTLARSLALGHRSKPARAIASQAFLLEASLSAHELALGLIYACVGPAFSRLIVAASP
uniref:Uncharacterized protein n=1 Tax=Mycena chlorophos TaxID=658473 RepID=A0ABQ0LWV9_MYCCL|nr:predicted protein [Mycena chlorophos]